MIRFSDAVAVKKLMGHAERMQNVHLRDMITGDTRRAENMRMVLNCDAGRVIYDTSRQRVDQVVLTELASLAKELHVKEKIQAMYDGEVVNVTEDRSVGHVALRRLIGEPNIVGGEDVGADVQGELAKVRAFSEKVLSGQHTGVTGAQIKNILAIGIGGSFLGPQTAEVGLRPFAQDKMRLRFVANVDGTDFFEKTADLDPAETLVIIISKTFTTAETMQNARTAKAWLLKGLNNHPDTVKKHMIAVSTATKEVSDFGIEIANMVGFWNWVGGRYSWASAVGAQPLSLYLGYGNFEQMLAGARWMDNNFLNAPLENNLALMAALLDVWNINFMGWTTRALLPYAQGLEKLPAHTQQVEMESNGKRVDMTGSLVDWSTGEVVFGEPGTNGQHSFYQLLHQGTQIIPADFLAFLMPSYVIDQAEGDLVSHHRELMTNFLAQPDALALGSHNVNLAKDFPGNRPSSSMLLSQLNPFTMGLLLAFTEHRAAAKGAIWGIDSFDQFGVELGKVLGKDHRNRMINFDRTGQVNVEGLTPSTAFLLRTVLGQ